MSEIRANTISDAAGTGPVTLTKQSAAKAWVNFNGTGTIAARDSFNVSSLTDNGTGNYTVNFTNAFGAGDYSAVSSAGDTSIRITQGATAANPTTTAYQFYTFNNSFAASDAVYLFLSVHGDLA